MYTNHRLNDIVITKKRSKSQSLKKCSFFFAHMTWVDTALFFFNPNAETLALRPGSSETSSPHVTREKSHDELHVSSKSFYSEDTHNLHSPFLVKASKAESYLSVVGKRFFLPGLS